MNRNIKQFRSSCLGISIGEIIFWIVLVTAVLIVNEFAPHVELHRPNYVIWLAILPVSTVAFIIHLRWKVRAAASLSDSKLQDLTIPGLSFTRESWKFYLWRLSIAMVLLGLLDPKVGSKLQEVETTGADIVIAIDVSNSMRAEDLGVERLDIAKQTVERILLQLGSDRVGLVIFAGEAYVQCPLTSDYGALRLFLNTISTDLVAVQGTALGAAIDVSVLAFQNAPEASRTILLITDGENHEDDPVDAASKAADAGITVHVLGLATPEGAPIPNYNRQGRKVGYIQGPDGEPVVSRLEESVLVATVQAGGGTFTRANKGYIDINPVIDALNKAEKTRTSNIRYTDYDHRFQIFLLIAIGLILFESIIPNPSIRS